MDGSKLLFMLSCGIAMVNHTHAQEILLLNFDETTPITTVTLHEDTTTQTSLAIVRCVGAEVIASPPLTVNPPILEDCVCNLVRTIPANGPFDVWKLKNNNNNNNQININVNEKDVKAFFIGTAKATSTLNYDTQRTHLILVRCASPTIVTFATSTVTIEVDILPNQQPVISYYPSATSQFFVANAAKPIGTTIYAVTANDPEGEALTYTMTQSPANNWLTIGANDGVIRTAVDTKVITSENIICTVTISDGKNTVNNFIVTARFQNLNTRPYISNLPSSITVTEIQTSGFVLETLTYGDGTPQTNQPALEPDCSMNPVSECYKVIYDSGTRHLILKTIATGQLDFKTTTKYLITCVLSDGYLSSEGDVLTLHAYRCTDQSTEESSSDDDAFFAALIALSSLTLLVVLWHVYCRWKKAAQQPPLTQVYPSHKVSKIPTMRP